MKINTIYQQYIQKSRIFLYPMLKIRRGVSVTPIDTFVSWDNIYSLEDCKLIVVYHLRDDVDFKRFEKERLYNNYLFHDFFELEDEKGAYVFDLSDYSEDYKKIVAGKYSQVSPFYKRIVLDFFKKHRTHSEYIESYLYPEKYWEVYSKLLKVNVNMLKGVGELCSIPDLERENLTMKAKVMNLTPIKLNL